MKKITLFILLASFILPMSLSAQSKFTNVSKNDIGLVKGVDKKTVNKLASRGLMPQSIPIQSGIKGIHRAPGKATTWDFEDVSQLEDWSAVDADNDGYNWGYYNNSELEGGRMTTHSGDGVMASASYDNSVGPLTPDNWLISPEVSLGGTLSLWACGQDKTYYREVFGIFVCVGEPTSLNDFKQVGANVTTTGTMTEYQFDLSEYAGETGYFAIRHYKITDMFYLNIDDVTLDPNKVAEKDPTVPTNLSVATASTSANVTWEDTDDVAWNLRYRVYSPNEAQTLSWDLEDTSQLSGWLVYDKDGDGNNWGYTSYGDTYAFFSASYLYNSGESLDPDNWLLSPEVKFGGTLSFKALSADPNYLDSFGVFLLLSEDMDKEDFANYAIQLGADQTALWPLLRYRY